MGSTFFNFYLINDFILKPYTINVSAANKQAITVNGSITVNIQIGTLRDNIKFLVVNELDSEIIIGNDQLKEWNTKIDYNTETVEFNNIARITMNICKKREEGRVKLIESIVLQPNSIFQVRVMTDATYNGSARFVYTLPQLQYRGMVYIRDGIIGKDCKATVWLCNHAPYK